MLCRLVELMEKLLSLLNNNFSSNLALNNLCVTTCLNQPKRATMYNGAEKGYTQLSFFLTFK